MSVYANVPEAVAQKIGAELWPSWGASEEGRERAAALVVAVGLGERPPVHELTRAERDRVLGLLHRELRGTRGAR